MLSLCILCNLCCDLANGQARGFQFPGGLHYHSIILSFLDGASIAYNVVDRDGLTDVGPVVIDNPRSEGRSFGLHTGDAIQAPTC